MSRRISLAALSVLTALGMIAPAASGAIVNLAAPYTLQQGYSVPPRDFQVASANVADSVPDLYTIFGNFGSGTAQIRTSNLLGEYRMSGPPGYIQTTQNVTTSSTPNDLDLGDVTGDGSADIVVGHDGGVGLTRGASNGIYTAFANVSGAPSESHTGVRLARVDANTSLDLVVVRANGLDVFYNNGSSTVPFATQTPLGFVTNPRGLAVADFDGDGVLDAATTTAADQRVVAFRANVSTPMTLANSLGLFTRPGAITAANVTGDGRPEIIVTEPDRGTVAVISTNSLPTTLGPVTRIPTGFSPVDVETGDLDGNGVLEVITANAASDTVTIAEVGGESKSFPAGPAPGHVAVANMNGDGIPDLIVQNESNFSVSPLVNLGVPAAPPAPTPSAPPILPGTASLKCSAKVSKKKVREISCTATLSKKSDVKSLSAVLNLKKKRVKSVTASPGKKLSFKFPAGLKAGSYSVKLTVTNKDGSKLSASKTVKVK